MEPLTNLIILAVGLLAGMATGMFLQSTKGILPQRQWKPDLERMEKIRWERKEKEGLAEFINSQETQTSGFATVYDANLMDWVKAVGEDREIVERSIMRVMVDGITLNLSTGYMREAIMRPDNQHFEEVSLVMRKLGVPVKMPR